MNITLTDKDNNTSVTAHQGDSVSVTLVWKPSTGYFWQEAGTDAGVLEQVRHEGDNPLPGANALVTFVFRIKKSGTIVLDMARPWSETTPPAKLFQVDVKVV